MIHRCVSSDSEMDDTSSDDDEWTSKTMAFMRSVQNSLFATALVVSKYYMTYHDKNDARIPIMCPPYLQDIQDIFLPKMHQIHQLHYQMIGPWINSVMTLQGQYFFLDHHD